MKAPGDPSRRSFAQLQADEPVPAVGLFVSRIGFRDRPIQPLRHQSRTGSSAGLDQFLFALHRFTRALKKTASRWYSRKPTWILVNCPTSTLRSVGTPILFRESACATGDTRRVPSLLNEMK